MRAGLADGPKPKRIEKGLIMERIIITIETGNAAFGDAPATEIGRILRDLAQRCERDGVPPESVRDINGNPCGTVQVD